MIFSLDNAHNITKNTKIEFEKIGTLENKYYLKTHVSNFCSEHFCQISIGNKGFTENNGGLETRPVKIRINTY